MTLYGWMIDGSSSVLRGEFAELDAKAEAKRVGGTCKAFAVYRDMPMVTKQDSPQKTDWSKAMSMQSIREVLQRHGPMTAEQIGARIDLGPSSISAQLKTLRERKEVFIAKWMPLAKGGPGRNRALFALGNAPDAIDTPRGKRKLARQARAKPVAVRPSVRPDCGMWSGLMV